MCLAVQQGAVAAQLSKVEAANKKKTKNRKKSLRSAPPPPPPPSAEVKSTPPPPPSAEVKNCTSVVIMLIEIPLRLHVIGASIDGRAFRGR